MLSNRVSERKKIKAGSNDNNNTQNDTNDGTDNAAPTHLPSSPLMVTMQQQLQQLNVVLVQVFALAAVVSLMPKGVQVKGEEDHSLFYPKAIVLSLIHI